MLWGHVERCMLSTNLRLKFQSHCSVTETDIFLTSWLLSRWLPALGFQKDGGPPRVMKRFAFPVHSLSQTKIDEFIFTIVKNMVTNKEHMRENGCLI